MMANDVIIMASGHSFQFYP